MILIKIKKIINQLANKYIYLKFCWGRTNSHIGIPLEVVEKIALFSIWLKVFGVDKYWMLGLFITIFAIFMFTFGHFDLKWKIMEREMELANKHNPEIRELIRRARER